VKIRFQASLSAFVALQVAVVTTVLLLGVFAYVYPELTGGDLIGTLRFFDVGAEASLPTYVSTLNLLLASLLLFVLYRHEQASGAKEARYWLCLAVFFLFLSVDEGAEFHELFGNFHRRYGFLPELLKSSSWLPLGMVVAALAAAFFLPFLRRLPGRTAAHFAVAGLLFAAGVIGFEFLGAVMHHTGYAERGDFVYEVRRLFEEGFEMYAIVVFNCALFREICVRGVALDVEARPGRRL
jgi:hypothetical protein